MLGVLGQYKLEINKVRIMRRGNRTDLESKLQLLFSELLEGLEVLCYACIYICVYVYDMYTRL